MNEPNAETAMTGFWAAIKTCFVKYARFKRRASRAEFWWFFLFTLLISMATLLLNPQGALQSLWMLAVLLPSLAVGARRLHDIGHNGWWQLLYLTVYGAPLLLILFCLKTKADEVIAAQNGMLTRIENRIGAWRAKIWAWAKLHPFRFVATTLVILFVLYAVCFLIFHIVADCPSDLENWETWLNWGLGIGALIAVVGLGGGAPLLGVGSIGWVGKTYFIGFSGSVGATAYNVFQPVSENTHVLFCF